MTPEVRAHVAAWVLGFGCTLELSNDIKDVNGNIVGHVTEKSPYELDINLKLTKAIDYINIDIKLEEYLNV